MGTHKGNTPAVTDQLPGYIVERNAQALAAGLTIERQHLKNGRLTTWYVGSERQWRKSTFCRHTDSRPFGATVQGHHFLCFSPAPCDGFGCISLRRKADGSYLGAINEQMPDRIDDLGDGIAAYKLNCPEGVEIVYVGPDEQALIDRKIAPAEIADKSWGHARDGRMLWRIETMLDDRCIFRDQVSVRQASALADAKSQAENHKAALPDFKHSTQLVSDWACVAGALLKILARLYKRTETKGGQIFAVNKDSLDTIDELTEELLDYIRCCPVSTRAKPAAVQPRQVENDGAFQHFMAALVPNAGAA